MSSAATQSGLPESIMEPAAPEAELPRFASGFAAKLNLTVDLLLVVCVLVVSTWLAADTIGTSTGMWLVTAAAVATWLTVGTVLCLYNTGMADRSPMDDLALLSILILVTMVVAFAVRSLMPSGTPLLPALSFFVPLLWPPVVLLRLLVFRPLSVQERSDEQVLIVGTGPMGRLTGEDLAAHGRRQVVGYIHYGDEAPPSELKAPVLGGIGELEHILRTVAVDKAYISGDSSRHERDMQAAIKLCERFGIPFALPACSFHLERAHPVALRAVADGYLHFETFKPKPHQMATKRLMDITLSAAALVVLGLPLLVVALAIKLSSRGPVFFKQQRIGLHGKPFNMLKFRSMVVNAEELKEKLATLNEMSGPAFKMRNDPRVTRVGRFIRKYSIDELPQLFNVLRGEMSLVGPRPPLPKEAAAYTPWQRRRLSVAPGLTCIWQVSGRNLISFEEWMYMDMQYIDNWSLKDDIHLILRTLPAVISGHGAS